MGTTGRTDGDGTTGSGRHLGTAMDRGPDGDDGTAWTAGGDRTGTTELAYLTHSHFNVFTNNNTAS